MYLDPILFYRCLSILDMHVQKWIMNKFLTKNIVLFRKYCIGISEHIVIETETLFLKMHFIKSEQSFKMP